MTIVYKQREKQINELKENLEKAVADCNTQAAEFNITINNTKDRLLTSLRNANQQAVEIRALKEEIHVQKHEIADLTTAVKVLKQSG